MYVVGVQAEDYEQDMDRTNRKRRTVDITVQVEVRNGQRAKAPLYMYLVQDNRVHTFRYLSI